MTFIYHIARQKDWQAAQQAGSYRADSLASQGFIHCSTKEQVVKVANVIFRGQPDLLLLVIEPEKLTAPLKFEPPDHPQADQPETDSGERFPHVYGALNLDSIQQVLKFSPDSDGFFTLPEEIAGVE